MPASRLTTVRPIIRNLPLIFILFILFYAPVLADPGPYTISVVPADRSFYVSETREYQIVLETVPGGLSGYEMTVALTNPGIAEITGVMYPTWAQLHANPPVPAQSVSLNGVDTGQQVWPGATTVSLATVSVKGDAEGATPLAVTVTTLDRDFGGSVQPSAVNGGSATINPVPPPVTAFTAEPVKGVSPLTVNFTDGSSGMFLSYAWDFENDGIIDSTSQNPVFTYASGGTYTVNLTVMNPGGSDTHIGDDLITAITLHPGSYTVSVIPENQSYYAGETRAYQLVLNSAPIGLAGFGLSVALDSPGIAEITGVTYPAWVQMGQMPALPSQSASIGGIDLSQQVSDGATGVLLATIAVKGNSAGVTPITPAVTSLDPDGGYVLPATPVNGGFADIMAVSPPFAGFSATPLAGVRPLAVQFSDESTGVISSYAWNFGDGATSSARSPLHTYTAAGTYTVSHLVTGPGGSDSMTRTGYIRVIWLIPLPGCTDLPTDPDGDGLYEDLNGNGVKDTNDVVLFFKNLTWMKVNEPIAFFDFNSNTALDTNDVVLLFKKKMT